MRGKYLVMLLGLWVALGPLAGCGENKLDRGVPVGQEEAVPTSPRELGDTAAERREQEQQQNAQKLRQEFDAAEEEASGGGS